MVIISIDEITENSFGSVWTLDFPVELVIFGTLEPGTQHVRTLNLEMNIVFPSDTEVSCITSI